MGWDRFRAWRLACKEYFTPKAELVIKLDDVAKKAFASMRPPITIQEIPDFLSMAAPNRMDLNDAVKRGLKIVFRDEGTGAEWEYDPDHPGRMKHIPKPWATFAEAEAAANVPVHSVPIRSDGTVSLDEWQPPTSLKAH